MNHLLTIIKRKRITRPTSLDRHKRPIRQGTSILDPQHICISRKSGPLHQLSLRDFIRTRIRRVNEIQQDSVFALERYLARVVGIVYGVGGGGVVFSEEEFSGRGLCTGEGVGGGTAGKGHPLVRYGGGGAEVGCWC